MRRVMVLSLLVFITGCSLLKDTVTGPRVTVQEEISEKYNDEGVLIEKTVKKETTSESAKYSGTDAKNFSTGDSKVHNGTAEAGGMNLSFFESSSMKVQQSLVV